MGVRSHLCGDSEHSMALTTRRSQRPSRVRRIGPAPCRLLLRNAVICQRSVAERLPQHLAASRIKARHQLSEIQVDAASTLVIAFHLVTPPPARHVVLKETALIERHVESHRHGGEAIALVDAAVLVS
jgi:hypothetical protein